MYSSSKYATNTVLELKIISHRSMILSFRALAPKIHAFDEHIITGDIKIKNNLKNECQFIQLFLLRI